MSQMLADFQELLMIEMARLQNSLIQSVPARVYERLLADFKRLLRQDAARRLINANAAGAASGSTTAPVNDDAGYDSDGAEAIFYVAAICQFSILSWTLAFSIFRLARKPRRRRRVLLTKIVVFAKRTRSMSAKMRIGAANQRDTRPRPLSCAHFSTIWSSKAT